MFPVSLALTHKKNNIIIILSLFLFISRPVQYVVKLKLVTYGLHMTVMRQEGNHFDLLVWKLMLNELPPKGQRKNEERAARMQNLIWFCSWLAHMAHLWFASKVYLSLTKCLLYILALNNVKFKLMFIFVFFSNWRILFGLRCWDFFIWLA